MDVVSFTEKPDEATQGVHFGWDLLLEFRNLHGPRRHVLRVSVAFSRR